MPRPGRLPSPDAQPRTGVPWTDVPDEPFAEGAERELPAPLSEDAPWTDGAVAWWALIRVMPHARLWRDDDWLYAADTAYLKNEFYMAAYTGTLLAEMRKREDIMGVGIEARQKLRIRYVRPVPASGAGAPPAPESAAPAPDNVTPIGGPRRRRSVAS